MNNNIRVIQSIQRAIDIINCFNETETALSINEISNKLSLHVNTTRGIVNTLVYNAYLDHDSAENKYSLGLVFIPKAHLVSANSIGKIKKIIHPYLGEIANKYQVSARLQLISKSNIFTVDTVHPEDSRYVLQTKTDTPFPLNATSSGKLFLYYSDEDKKENYLSNINQKKYTEKTIVDRNELEKELEFIDSNGFSIEDEEVGPGMSSIAIPLLDNTDTFIGTISITSTSSIVEKVYKDALVDMEKISKKIKKDRF